MKKKMLKRVLVSAFAVITAVSTGSTIASAAGNYQDRYETIYYQGDGGDVITTSREKWDYTSAYCKNLSDSGCNLQGVDVVATPSYDPMFYWNPKAYRATIGDIRIPRGVAKYIPNYVKEKGYYYCNLQMMPSVHTKTTIKIAWSPDSI